MSVGERKYRKIWHGIFTPLSYMFEIAGSGTWELKNSKGNVFYIPMGILCSYEEKCHGLSFVCWKFNFTIGWITK